MPPPKRKPSTAAGTSLTNTLILPHSPSIRRLLSRLSKDSLLELVLTWLDPTTVHLYNPDLTSTDDEDDEDLELDAVHETYEGYKKSRAVKAKDIVERIIEREWRSGLNLLQIAELDYRYLLDHPTAHKWTAAILHPLNRSSSNTTAPVPRFHAPAFTHALNTTMRPLVTSHYFIARHRTLPLTLLRLQIHPPGTTLELPGSRRIFWLVFPASAPGYLYHNIPAGGADNLRDIVRVSIASAISRPHARFELRPSAMSARTLEALCYYRGSGGGEGGMVGAWSIYSDGTLESGPLEVPPPKRQAGDIIMGEAEDGETVKRRKIAEGRFGGGAKAGDGKGLETVEFRVEDKFPALPAGIEAEEDDADFRPAITLRLEGTHVFAGIRGMVEEGVGFDGIKMPGWITGEGGVSIGTVRDGRLLKKGR